MSVTERRKNWKMGGGGVIVVVPKITVNSPFPDISTILGLYIITAVSDEHSICMMNAHLPQFLLHFNSSPLNNSECRQFSGPFLQ